VTLDNGCLLITGGTGSFGDAVLSKLISSSLREIRIFSRDEKKQHDMRLQYDNQKLRLYIGDVRDEGSLMQAMHGVDYVFHAAALKQVPSCEFHPIEAVRTNVLGTQHVLNAAQACGVRKIVCLSTDKAVYPVSAMGASKTLMEKVIIAKSREFDPSRTLVCTTRYGNVMASRGSVIPLFVDQIQRGKPLTLTDPNMTRFMMTLDVAVRLVMFAFTNGSNGDTYVQKSPATSIGTLARALCQLFGVPEHPIEIIGTRHGEKRCETLLSHEEIARAQDCGQHFRIWPENRDLNNERYFERGEFSITTAEDFNSDNAQQLNLAETRQLLLTLPLVQVALGSSAVGRICASC
jgi:UDP-N-acetylglucosamine 4,6-dehydratase/5-epimerase